jgi:gamma-glutamyl phosphate reductase
VKRGERCYRQRTLGTSISTRDKLVRAAQAAARLAQLTTTEKDALLLAIAEAIAAHAAEIMAAAKDWDEGYLCAVLRSGW